MIRRVWCSLAFVVAPLIACASGPVTNTMDGTGIYGKVTMSGLHGGPNRPGEHDEAPVGKRVFVVRAGDNVVTEFTTDERGEFRVLLAPGSYTIRSKTGKAGFGGCGPYQVEIVAGQMLRTEWQCASGMK